MMESTLLANPVQVALLAAAQVIAPPPPVDYEMWAVENIEFSKRESAFPGRYDPKAFPFFSEILRALGPDDACRFVTLKKSAQIGGTVLANIFTLGSLDLDPCDFLYVHPTEDNAQRWSKLKLKPMMKTTACIKAAFPSRPRDGGDSVLFKERMDGRGSILISGANSPSSLSMVSMPRQVQDDLAKYEINSAGDPERQADSRSRAYDFAKVFKNSTPLVVPGCRISKNYTAGTQEIYLVPCPHCGHKHALDWANMLANLNEDHPERAHFTCPECGCEINQHHRPAMVRDGEWFAQNPNAAREHRSFYLWSAYSPLQSWEQIAREWFAASGDPASEQVFLNDAIGLAYETKGEAPPWEDLRDRAQSTGHKRGTIPAGAVVLTLGIDCQSDRVEWQLVGFGRDRRRWVIDVGVIVGHISEKSSQDGLNHLLETTWRNAVGREISIDMAAIDGNAWTEEVFDWAKKHPAGRVIMVRGRGEETAPLLARVQKERNRRTGKVLRYSKRFYNFGASVLKMALYRNVKKSDPAERGFVGFPSDLDDEYFRQLTAERRVPVKRRDGFIAYKWEKDATQANEALDTMLQAEAAAIKFGVRTMPPAVWDRIEANRETPPEDPQLDLEDVRPETSAQTEKPKSKSGKRARRGSGFVKSWSR
jgi:phage terminase large subunit GpA-like protein